MSGREWRAGDVAMVEWQRHRGDGSLVIDDGAPARPLVVIDAEDREQVERLLGLFYEKRAAVDRDPIHGNDTDAMQAALREFADPKPPCGASLTLGKDAALYRCSEPEGHDGPHVDGTCIWGTS